MKISMLFILNILFLGAISLHSMEFKKPEHCYLRHLTNSLPAPSMLVGGLPITYRPTLHWSILGPEVKDMMATMEISTEGVTKYVPYSIEKVKKKYAVIERLDILAPHIIGGEYMDIFTLGEHKPSQYAYLFIPQDEEDPIDKIKYKCNIVIYDNNIYTISEAVDNFANEHNLMKIIFATPALSTKQPWEFLGNRTKFITEAINMLCPSLMQETPIEIEEMNQQLVDKGCFSNCISFSFTIEEILYDVAFIPVSVNNVIHLVLWFSEDSPERFKIFRYFWLSANENVKFDTFLYTNCGKTTLRDLFSQYDVPLDLCNIGHYRSGLLDLENKILSIPLDFKEKWILYKDFSNSISERLEKIISDLDHEYANVVTEKLRSIPSIFVDELNQFFCYAYKHALIERYNFVIKSINNSKTSQDSLSNSTAP